MDKESFKDIKVYCYGREKEGTQMYHPRHLVVTFRISEGDDPWTRFDIILPKGATYSSVVTVVEGTIDETQWSHLDPKEEFQTDVHPNFQWRCGWCDRHQSSTDDIIGVCAEIADSHDEHTIKITMKELEKKLRYTADGGGNF